MFDKSLAGWQRLIDGVRSMGWGYEYSEDARRTPLPHAAADLDPALAVARLGDARRAASGRVVRGVLCDPLLPRTREINRPPAQRV